MSFLALDIGGANLKIAHCQGFAASQPFALWQRPAALAGALQELLATAPAADGLAVTMTGELADCFSSKAEGVASILAAVEQAAGRRQVFVYLWDGRIIPPEALDQPLLAAASNWHALATYAARFCQDGAGLLIDLGSTTCDIIPIEHGQANASGCTDPERLITRELVYTGVERSPVCAVVSQLLWHGEMCPVAKEVFATTADAYLLLGQLPENDENLQTADGRPRTPAHAHARLARAICADTSLFSRADAGRAAETIRDAQLEQLSTATKTVLRRMETPPRTLVISGQGEFLLRRLLEQLALSLRLVSLTEQLGPQASRAAAAYALAVLAEERAPL
ncbi:MAG: tetrahydromethanopterin-linked C1 transfer pathway [Pirellulales bacterium]|nr:tetrahydromethanopterin-linked C1 transfer pathway [Pirellulales bacterium]